MDGQTFPVNGTFFQPYFKQKQMLNVPGPSRPELSCSCTIIIVLIDSYNGCAHSCFSTAVALGEMFPFGPVQLK